MTSAVLFAYHDVGVRCMTAVLDLGIEVPLVVSHRDDPGENIFFGSVAALAAARGIECLFPENPESPELLARLSALRPDFLFSFYYRRMLKPALLACARRGAFNMHGSLLPKYRGRAPVNWAVLHGETETGATLHEMLEKPDAGRIVDRQAVPIGPDDTAGEVFARVTAAAETVARRAIPRLVDGSAVLVAQDLAQGGYFGGRKPADGRIDWRQGARQVHNLVRAVAPPYPGAFTHIGGEELKILRTRLIDRSIPGVTPPALLAIPGDNHVTAVCADSGVLAILEMQLNSTAFTPAQFLSRFGPDPISMQAI